MARWSGIAVLATLLCGLGGVTSAAFGLPFFSSLTGGARGVESLSSSSLGSHLRCSAVDALESTVVIVESEQFASAAKASAPRGQLAPTSCFGDCPFSLASLLPMPLSFSFTTNDGMKQPLFGIRTDGATISGIAGKRG
jgi:hypothetical protein